MLKKKKNTLYNVEQSDPQESDAYSFLCMNCYAYISPTICPVTNRAGGYVAC